MLVWYGHPCVQFLCEVFNADTCAEAPHGWYVSECLVLTFSHCRLLFVRLIDPLPQHILNYKRVCQQQTHSNHLI